MGFVQGGIREKPKGHAHLKSDLFISIIILVQYGFLQSVARPDSRYAAWYLPDVNGKVGVRHRN